MPELPEVETTCRGINPYVVDNEIKKVIVRERRLRWPIDKKFEKYLTGQSFSSIERRAKYLLFNSNKGTMILHLGMSGSLRIITDNTAAEKHDHVDIIFADDKCLRFHDPRRFGSIHFTTNDPNQHKLLKSLGPEPLSKDFNTEYLFKLSRNKNQAVKNFIMDSHIVVGVGNIYASESLFAAGIRPSLRANRVSLQRYELLVKEIKQVLMKAIKKGGTTLRDFVNGEGKPGYFRHELKVYGREQEECFHCDSKIKLAKIGQRSSYYCPKCQK